VRKVRGRKVARIVILGDHHFFSRTLLRTPLLEMALQGTELSGLESIGVFTDKMLENSLGHKAGVLRNEGLDFDLDFRKGVGAGSPGMRGFRLGRECPGISIAPGGFPIHT
jgi:hypothetical protein